MSTTKECKARAQADADELRRRARGIELEASRLSDEQGGAELEQHARSLRKEAQEIEKWLPSPKQ